MMRDSNVLLCSPCPWMVKSSESVDDVGTDELSHVLYKGGRVCTKMS